jgi:hypothetical protein
MHDDVIRVFRRRVSLDAPRIRDESTIVRVVAGPMSGDPPSRYHGLFSGVEHFERGPNGTLCVSGSPLPFSLEFPDDYCSCVDGSLQLRVARVHAPIAHPNLGPGGIVRPLIEHLYRICSGRVFASESPFDPSSAEFFRRHPDRVRALRAEPLWHRPVAGSVRVETAHAERGAR